MQPVRIEIKDKKELMITWDDDVVSEIKLVNLRNNCPCAVCNAEKDERSSSYFPIYTKEQLSITDINIVGYYAVAISWKDGHKTGMYEFNKLRELANNGDH